MCKHSDLQNDIIDNGLLKEFYSAAAKYWSQQKPQYISYYYKEPVIIRLCQYCGRWERDTLRDFCAGCGANLNGI